MLLNRVNHVAILTNAARSRERWPTLASWTFPPIGSTRWPSNDSSPRPLGPRW